jgi:hypothetical protein
MEMSLGTNIEKVVSTIRLSAERNDNIVAFGELHFYPPGQESPLLKVKGFTIRLVRFPKSQKPILSVSFPAFPSAKSKSGFQTSFIVEDELILKSFRELLLKEYYQASGGLLPKEIAVLKNINPEEIPI